MVYRSTHHHAVTYHKGERVKFNDWPAVITEGGHKFGAIAFTIDETDTTIKLGPYDEVWPEKVL